jgi:N-acetylglutamate synthase-like GNAT family acetyltransferase
VIPLPDHTAHLIRPFAAADAEGVVELVLTIQQQEFGLPITADEQPDLLNVSAYYQRARGNFWVASDNGQIVGTIGLLDVGDACGVVRKMFVAASHRGTEVAAGLLQTCLIPPRTVAAQPAQPASMRGRSSEVMWDEQETSHPT